MNPSNPLKPLPAATFGLLVWVNTHDCGASPTGVLNDDDSITIRVATVHANGDVSFDHTRVRTLAEARVALGY